MKAAVVAICVAALAGIAGCAGRGPACHVGAELFRPPAYIHGSGGELDGGIIGIFLTDADGSDLYVALDRSGGADVEDSRLGDSAASGLPVLYVGLMGRDDRGSQPVPAGGAEEKGVICLLRSYVDRWSSSTQHQSRVARAETVLSVLEQRG